jgi:aldose 1-epimerase
MITRHPCGTIDRQVVEAFSVEAGPYRMRLLSLGAILQEMHTPDLSGSLQDIAIGYDLPGDYLRFRGSAGAICGRFANRISDAQFRLDGTVYRLSKNLGENHLHGGHSGFNRKVWHGEILQDRNAVRFDYSSADGEEGYPGGVDATVTYALSETGLLSVEMEAHSDKATVINLVHHGYWNLAGHASGDIRDQVLWVNADQYTPVTAEGIPTGELRSVDGIFDFRTPKPIGGYIDAEGLPGGYDHNFCLAGVPGEIREVIAALDPVSGRGLAISTDQVGVQLYTGNHFGAAPNVGKGGHVYPTHAGFALETQGFPNAPNQPNFPSTVLRPGETYRHRMNVQFFARAIDDFKVPTGFAGD